MVQSGGHGYRLKTGVSKRELALGGTRARCEFPSSCSQVPIIQVRGTYGSIAMTAAQETSLCYRIEIKKKQSPQ